MSRRLPAGGAIDRARPIPFTFDGRAYVGYAGDTLASALLGAGVAVVGRSFKYHRPRGVYGHWVEEPNAIFDLTRDGRREPNARATTTFLEAGVALAARSVNASPDAERDRAAVIDLFARFMPSGFYYKTFLWPSWKVFEPAIRAMAGLGRLDPQWKPAAPVAPRNRRCEVLVVGAGPSGLAAARAAAEAGMGVLVVDDRPAPGGSLFYRGGAPDGVAAGAWIAETVAAIESAGGAFLANATAYGVYDHNLVCAFQRGVAGAADTLWRIRPRHIVVAAGAIERPLLFDHNDLPGVMLGRGRPRLSRPIRRAGRRTRRRRDQQRQRLCGRRRVERGRRRGDDRRLPRGRDGHGGGGGRRAAPRRTRDAGRGSRRRARGPSCQRRVDRSRRAAGLRRLSTRPFSFIARPRAARSGTSGCSPSFPAARSTGLPSSAPPTASSRSPARFIRAAPPSPRCAATAPPTARSANAKTRSPLAPAWPDPKSKRPRLDRFAERHDAEGRRPRRARILSLDRARQALHHARHGDRSGQDLAVNGVAALAARSGRKIAEVGTTTYRPPFTPVPMTALAGLRRGELLNPLRRLPLEAHHRALGAVFDEYGGWLRPAFYGEVGAKAAAIEREVARWRATASRSSTVRRSARSR